MKKIGMVAEGTRNIKSGEQYNALIPKPEYKKELLKSNSNNISDTMRFMGQIIGKYYKDTARLAPKLVGNSKIETCHNIWDFVYNHIQYTTETDEQLPRPSYTWHVKRFKGADCDDYAIFISSILLNLKINHIVRITKYNGGVDYQHVYIVVPDGSSQIIVDPVLNYFNKEEIYTAKKDYTMQELGVNIYGLKGVTTNPMLPIGKDMFGELPLNNNPMLEIGSRLFGCPSLGEVSEDDQILGILVASRDTLVLLPDLMANSTEWIKMYQLAIDNWNTPYREEALLALQSYDDGLSGSSGLAGTFFGNLIRSVVSVVKKINPVSIVIRNAFLLCLKVNLFGMSTKLVAGYYTDYNQISTKCTKDEWAKAVKACSELGETYKAWGGDAKFVRAAVMTDGRKLAGLGVAPLVAPAAITAAAPLLLVLTNILKGLGMDDANSKALASVIGVGGSALANAALKNMEANTTQNTDETPLTTPAITSLTTTTPTIAGMNMYLMIGLGLAAVAAVYMATKGKSNANQPQRASPHRLNGIHKKVKAISIK